MSAGVLLQAVVSGLALGAVYGLVALGFTVVWSLTRVLAFMHGDVVVAAVLVAVLLVVGRTPVASSPGPASSVGLVVLALVTGVAVAVLAYVVAVRPFLGRTHRSEDVLGWVAGVVTVGLVIRAGLGLAFPAAAYAVPDPLHLDALTSSGVVALPGGGTVAARVFPVLGVGLVVAAATDRLLHRSRVGRGMRAVADDADAAAMCGVAVERAVLVAFAVAGLLAGVAGLLIAPGRALSVDDGAVLGLTAAAAALLGRLGSTRGAVVAGLGLGVAQQLAATQPHLGARWSQLLPVAVLVAVLALRPEGLRAPRRAVAE